MPMVDGYQVIKTIREQDTEDSRFPVIVMTADVQMAQRQTYMELGFDECLLKPISLAQVRRLMMRWGLLPDALPAAEEQKIIAETTSSPNKSIPIDLSVLKDMLGGLDESAAEMLTMFVEMTEPLINDLKEAYQKQDWHQFAEIGHSVKGSAYSAGANNLGDICGKIQDDAGKADDATREIMLDDAQSAFEDVKSYITGLNKDSFKDMD
jgi:HPt (histidine-containing phosphotransfer) domain-containing protein